MYNIYACGVLLFCRASRYGVSYAEIESSRNARGPPQSGLITPSQLSGYALSQQVPMRECALYPQENIPIASQSNLGHSNMGHNFVPYSMRQSKTSIATNRTDDLRVESDISEENSFQAFPVCHVTGKSIRPVKPESSQDPETKTKRQSSLRQSHRSKSNERRKPEKSVSFRGPISSD